MTEFQEYLVRIGACREARIWAGERTAQQAWDECDRADWLLWWAATEGVDRKVIVRTACACARLALRFVPTTEKRPLEAIETAERWCDGLATIDEVMAAGAAAAPAVAGIVARGERGAVAAAVAAEAATGAALVAAWVERRAPARIVAAEASGVVAWAAEAAVTIRQELLAVVHREIQFPFITEGGEEK